ncbi:hypothetical protein ABMY26_32105 [Azospirillum sp. HJ39]|uniref:hypothetical protein n=1 Tax=Azospirillum sp. HJ39 TaxID=3159496 RepID=UPI003557DF89
MTEQNWSLHRAWLFLRGYRDALEPQGETPSATSLAHRLGFATSTGPRLRNACIELGWVEVVEPPHGNLPGVLQLTEAGRAAAARQSPPVATLPPAVQRPKPVRIGSATPGKGTRRCLCCGSEFHSTGPGNRICNGCRATDTYRSGDVGIHSLRLSR